MGGIRCGSGAGAGLLSLPYELRQLVYQNVFDREYIIFPRPRPCRYLNRARRPKQTVFFHPDPGNLQVWGINSATLHWTIQTTPSPRAVSTTISDRSTSKLFSYQPPNNADPLDSPSIDTFYPWPLGAVCSALHDEVHDFILTEKATFAFASADSLVCWLNDTSTATLAHARSLKLEIHLSIVAEATMAMHMAAIERHSQSGGSLEIPYQISEDDQPWFGALKLARQRLIGLCAFTMHVELCGPALESAGPFEPVRKHPEVSPLLEEAFRRAALRMIDEAEQLIPNDRTVNIQSSEKGKNAEADAADQSLNHELPRNNGRKLTTSSSKDPGGTDKKVAARSVHVVAVQRYAPSVWGEAACPTQPLQYDWTCPGREFELGSEIASRCAALEVLPSVKPDVMRDGPNINNAVNTA